ncbi:uncharacterized protein LOC116343151 [Contarinia nasturtii]|uniref:uncharacterized protein LOC116343151 n=1 Tax=Contarinia nasturtii TaxID=265458 RepID=UPI0012D450F0|nr:uncharacterized protein LOC116343151 [Contarinia nasturtii]
MAEALFLLQEACSETKAYNGFSKLPHGYHKIYKFKLANNKQFNPKEKKTAKKVLLVELKDEVLFLPEYFALAIKEDERKVFDLNNDGVEKFLFFGGARPNKSWIIRIHTLEEVRAAGGLPVDYDSQLT